MKYTVTINQSAAAKVAPELDFGDLAIYDFIKSFAVSGNCITIYEGGKCYYWIAHSVIMQELPLLHISTKRGIVKKIDNLINAGILEKYSKCAEMGRTFYTFGVNAALLETNTQSAKSTTVNKSSGDYEQKFRGTMNKSSGNYNIKDNINKDNNNVGGFENPPTTPAPDNIINVDVEEMANDPITVSAETITPPSSAAPPLNDEARANKKTLFRNSAAADRETFFKTFSGEEYATLDMEYYYNAVADWSDSSNTMRTPRGWVATVRTFIRGDKEKNRLHKKQSSGFDWEAAKAYLRM